VDEVPVPLPVSYLVTHFAGMTTVITVTEIEEVRRRIVTFLIIAPYKYSYLLTYLLTSSSESRRREVTEQT